MFVFARLKAPMSLHFLRVLAGPPAIICKQQAIFASISESNAKKYFLTEVLPFLNWIPTLSHEGRWDEPNADIRKAYRIHSS
jgi:hypothetical protein